MTKLFIYRISQEDNSDCDTYDSAIVVASSALHAKHIYPGASDSRVATAEDAVADFKDRAAKHQLGTWTEDTAKVRVEIVGTAKHGLAPGVLLTSFNAG